MALTDKEKKAAQRLRQKALGMKKVEVLLSNKDREQLAINCEVRGGVRGKYSADEYLAQLLRNDTNKLNEQLEKLGGCVGCTLKLPEGCGGVCKGQNDCWHTHKAKTLML